MLDLDSIVFKCDTAELDAAALKIDKLATNMSKLVKPVQQAEIDSSKLAEAKAKEAKAVSQAAEAAAKAEKAQNNLSKASKTTEEATEKSSKALERQKMILEGMIDGFTRGQSGVLATARAAGIATDELAELQKTLSTIQKISGRNPLDDTLGGLTKLTNQLGEAREANRLYTAGIELTKTQTRELARDKDRIIEKAKAEGASLSEIKERIRELNAEYIKTATAVNTLATAEKNKIKADRDAINAKNALAKEDQRLISMLETMNLTQNQGSVATDKAANSIARYAQMLRTAGVSGAEFEKRLESAKKKILELDEATKKNQVDYVTRAVGPQLTDIFSGLATGQQSLYTIMIQQGGQLADQFALAGIEANKMGEVLKNALPNMLTNITNIGKALGTMFVGGIQSAGKSVIEFTTGLVGLDGAFNNALKSGNVFASGLALTVGGTILAAVAAVVAFGIALVKVTKEQDDLTRQLNLTGGSLATTTHEVIKLSESMQDGKINTSKMLDVVRLMAKEGGFVSSEIAMIGKAALEMQKYFDVAAEDTVKSFAKIKEEPSKALAEIAKQTGLISVETLKLIKELESQGKFAEAAALAMKAYADVQAEQVAKIKREYTDFGLFMIELGSKISSFWGGIKNLAQNAISIDPKAKLKEQITSVKELLNNEAGVAGFVVGKMGIGKEGYQQQLSVLEENLRLMNRAADAQATAQADNAKAARDLEFQQKAYAPWKDKLDKDVLTRQEYISEAVKEYTKALKGAAVVEKDLADIQMKAGLEWDKAHKAKKDGTESFYESSMKKFKNATIESTEALEFHTKAYAEYLKVQADPKYAKLTEQQKESIRLRFEEAEASELVATREETRSKALVNLLANQAKAAGFNKDYYKQLRVMDMALLNGAITLEEYNLQLSALNNTQPAVTAVFKEAAKVYEETAKKQEQLDKTAVDLYDSQAKLNLAVEAETNALALRLQLLGSTEEARKKAIALAKIENEYLKEKADIESGKFGSEFFTKADALNALEQRRLQRQKNVNTETAVDAAEKMLKEYERIRDGLSDSIVTALFDGGKAGSKQLRSLIEAELRKPITMIVRAMVDTVMGGGSAIAGSASSGMLGSIGSAFIGSSSALGLGAQAGFGALMNGGLFEAVSAGATALVQGTMSSFAAGLGTLAGALGPIAAVAMLLSSLDDSGTYHTGGLGSYSKATGVMTGNAVKSQGLDFNLASKDYTSSSEKAAASLAQGIVTILDSTASTFGKEAGYYAATAFADDTSKDGAWGALMVKLGNKFVVDWKQGEDKWPGREFADGEAGAGQYAAAVAKDLRQILIDMDLPEWASDILQSIGDDPSMEQLTEAMQTINQMPAAILQSIGTSVEDLSGILVLGMQNADPEGAGQAFADQITYGIEMSLYQGFAQQVTSIISTQLVTPVITAMAKGATITEAMSKASVETMLTQVRNAGTAFAAIVNNPEFKAALEDVNKLISGAVSGGISGFTAPTAPANYADSFKVEKQAKESKQALTDAEKEAEAEAKRLADSLKSLAKDKKQLEAELLKLQGKTTEANDALRLLATEGMVRAEIEAWDYNETLRKQISRLNERNGLENELLQLQGNTTELRRRELEALDPMNRALQESIWLIQDVSDALDRQLATAEGLISDSRKATDSAYAVLEKSTKKEIDSINELIEKRENDIKSIEKQLDTQEKAKDSLKEIFELISTNVKELYGTVDSTKKLVRTQAAMLITEAVRTGVLPDKDKLSDAIGTIRESLDTNIYSTKFEQDKARLVFANELNQLQDIADDQLSEAEQLIVQAKNQVAELQKLNTDSKEQITALNKQLENWKEQIEIARGTYVATMDVAKAVYALAQALNMEKQMQALVDKNLIVGSGGAVYNKVDQTGKNSQGAVFNGPAVTQAAITHLQQGGSAEQIYTTIKNSGFTLAQAEAILGATPGSLTKEVQSWNNPLLPAFSVGTDYVPQDMIAQIHEGEMIVPKQFNPANVGTGADMVEQLELLRYELRANVQHTSKLAKQLERLTVPTNEGEALQTKAVV